MGIREFTVGPITYHLAPIKTGQMREMADRRRREPDWSFMEENMLTVSYCLSNAGTAFTLEQVADIPWPVYTRLYEIACEVSEFGRSEAGKAGEELAAKIAALTGTGSTAASPTT